MKFMMHGSWLLSLVLVIEVTFIDEQPVVNSARSKKMASPQK